MRRLCFAGFSQQKEPCLLGLTQNTDGRGLESETEYDMMNKTDLPDAKALSRREKRGD